MTITSALHLPPPPQPQKNKQKGIIARLLHLAAIFLTDDY